MCQFSFGISSQHLNISHCSEPKTVFVAPPFPTDMREHSHVRPAHIRRGTLPEPRRRQNGTSVCSERFKR